MDYAGRQRDPTKHLMGLAIVILLHVAIAYALMTGLARKVVEVVRAPIETKIIEEIRKKAPEPDKPPPPPKLAPPPPPYIPPPEVNIAQLAPTPSPNVITAVSTTLPKEPPAPPAPVKARDPVRVAAVIDAARSCEKPDYPASSKRLEEEGTVTLRFLIDVDGHVVESKVDNSSGYERLDKAAVAGLSKCKFKPGSVDGKPEQSWASLKYTFRLDR